MEVIVGMKKEKMGFEETELRLGIGSTKKASEEVVRKRGFCETESHDDDENTTMDLMLNLSSKEASGEVDPSDNKIKKNLQKEKTLLPDPAKPPTK
jgi:auxin-responsive protein IAA